jgi:Serine incorporator (Serinc)
MQFKKTEAESEDDVPYGFGSFHFVFAMGAMYFAMLFIGWKSHQNMQKYASIKSLCHVLLFLLIINYRESV